MFLALISLERFYAVLWSLRHRLTSTRACIYSIVIVRLAGFSMAGLWLLIIYQTKEDAMFASVTIDAFLSICLLIICASYYGGGRGGCNFRINSKKGCSSGETQNSSGNMIILPGIGRLGKFSGRLEVTKLKFREFRDILGICPKNSDVQR